MLPDPPVDCKAHALGRRDNAPMRRTVKRLLGAGLVAAAAYAVWRAFDGRRTGSDVRWEPQPFPYPPVPRAPATNPTWVDPVDGACPATHPVKGKLASGIFHLPGGASYDRTRPDRCYLDAAAAETDGLRAAKA